MGGDEDSQLSRGGGRARRPRQHQIRVGGSGGRGQDQGFAGGTQVAALLVPHADDRIGAPREHVSEKDFVLLGAEQRRDDLRAGPGSLGRESHVEGTHG